jgi:guanylate kinase
VTLARPAFPVVISAPSGAGKTTLARRVTERLPDVVFSISATTRPPRPGEQDGRDYHFVDDRTFDRMIERDELAEWAVVHGSRYGTPRREITGAIERGRTVLLDIDIQGARQVRRLFPGAFLIFILPPSGAELGRRLAGRASEGHGERRRRLANAQRELAAAAEFDCVIVNDELDQAVEDVAAILRAEWASVRRLARLDRHLQALIRELDTLLAEE